MSHPSGDRKDDGVNLYLMDSEPVLEDDGVNVYLMDSEPELDDGAVQTSRIADTMASAMRTLSDDDKDFDGRLAVELLGAAGREHALAFRLLQGFARL